MVVVVVVVVAVMAVAVVAVSAVVAVAAAVVVRDVEGQRVDRKVTPLTMRVLLRQPPLEPLDVWEKVVLDRTLHHRSAAASHLQRHHVVEIVRAELARLEHARAG